LAYTTVPTIVTGDVATASWGNTYIKNNFAATAVGVVTTAGDVTYATAANVLARLGIGSSGRILRSTGSAPAWADFTDGSLFNGDHLDIDYTPSAYTPTTSPAEAADVDDLAAHLAGIDAAIAAGITVEATKANMEAEATGLLYVPPDLVRNSPGVAKFWALVNSAGTLAASYNITSVAHNGTGDWTVTIATNFSSADYAPVVCPVRVSTVSGEVWVESLAAGTFDVRIRSATSTDLDVQFIISGHGDQ